MFLVALYSQVTSSKTNFLVDALGQSEGGWLYDLIAHWSDKTLGEVSLATVLVLVFLGLFISRLSRKLYVSRRTSILNRPQRQIVDMLDLLSANYQWRVVPSNTLLSVVVPLQTKKSVVFRQLEGITIDFVMCDVNWNTQAVVMLSPANGGNHAHRNKIALIRKILTTAQIPLIELTFGSIYTPETLEDMLSQQHINLGIKPDEVSPPTDSQVAPPMRLGKESSEASTSS